MDQIPNIKFPTWEEITANNQPYIDNKSYKGYMFKENLSDGLYIIIDCQNESFIHPNDENVIRFALANKGEFAISSARYVNCEEGYIAGCVHLLNAAHDLSAALNSFARYNLPHVLAEINTYNENNPIVEEEEHEE